MKKEDDFLNWRKSYANTEANLHPAPQDPFNLFKLWLGEAAKQKEIREPNAMHLATVDASGKPHGRIVLLRNLYSGEESQKICATKDAPLFVFYTNYQSAKGKQIASCAQAALTFWWEPLARQVRIEGTITKLDEGRSDAYFATRPYGHKISAVASPQSSTLRDPLEMIEMTKHTENKYPDDPVPRPHHWGGYALGCDSMEFWQGQPDRRHMRLQYTRQRNLWQTSYLAP